MNHFISGLLLNTAIMMGCKAAAGPDLGIQADDLYKNRQHAISQLETKIENNSSANMAKTLVYAGEQRRLNGDDVLAKAWFERALDKYEDDPFKVAALIGLTLIDAKTSTSGNTIGRLKLYAVDPILPDTMRADLNRILSIHFKDSSPDSSSYYGKQAWKYGASDPSTLQRLTRDLKENPAAIIAQTPTDTKKDTTDGSVDKIPPDATTAPEPQTIDLAFQEIKTQIQNKQYELVVELCDQFEAAHPDSHHLSAIAALKSRAVAKEPFNRRKIGVMLPLTHPRYSPLAIEYKQTIEFAVSQLVEPVEVVFFDTKGEAALSKKGVNQLVTEDGVALILGPILKTSVYDAAIAAQEYEVPMITLSRTNDPLAAGDNLFFINMDNESQIDALVNHAINDREIMRFVALAPDTPVGHMNVDYFKEAVEERGGLFLRSEFYDKSQKDFTQQARLLGGKPPNDKGSQRLKPIVDFDAIFIPDNFRRTPLVASALAFEGFAVGGFRPQKGSKPIMMLGLSQWNNPNILKTSSNYLKNAIFVDAFWPEDEQESVELFTDKFQGELRRRPKNKNAIVYDAITLISEALSDGIESRSLVKEGLMRIELQQSLTNGTGFNEKRQFNRKLLIMEIGSKSIRKWAQPED